MLNIFLINRDEYLCKELGYKYKGTFNQLEQEDKYAIIDKLVHKMQKTRDAEKRETAIRIFYGKEKV